MPEFNRAQIIEDGRAPAMELLIQAASRGEFVTYGQLATHLNQALRLQGVTPHHVGYPVGTLMENILEIRPEAPLINLLVVRRDSSQPGEGADEFLKKRYGYRNEPSWEKRAEMVQTELNNARMYKDWAWIYKALFATDLDALPTINPSDYDDDGQGDNPKFALRGGLPESPEHRRLKQHVFDHPNVLRAKLDSPLGRIEAPLPSGDRMDVEFVDGARRIGVEVKSIRSQDADLRRGIYQCVKYRAVMVAESGVDAELAKCEVFLVTERPLAEPLRILARSLDVATRVVRVN